MLRAGLVALVMGLPLSAQQVPEGVHSTAKGAETICGISADSALAFKAQIEAAGLMRTNGGRRFDLYMTARPADDMVQWAMTKPTEPAHPTVTCRHLHKTSDGAIMQDRRMRCEADRAACDALFLEFEQLDALANLCSSS